MGKLERLTVDNVVRFGRWSLDGRELENTEAITVLKDGEERFGTFFGDRDSAKAYCVENGVLHALAFGAEAVAKKIYAFKIFLLQEPNNTNVLAEMICNLRNSRNCLFLLQLNT